METESNEDLRLQIVELEARVCHLQKDIETLVESLKDQEREFRLELAETMRYAGSYDDTRGGQF